MRQARFVQSGEQVDFVADAAVRAGDVVLFGGRAWVAKTDTPADGTGVLSAVGVFDVVKTPGAIGRGLPVYWSPLADAVNGEVGAATADSSGAVPLGTSLAAAAAEADSVRVLLGTVGPPTSAGGSLVWNQTPLPIGGNRWRLGQFPTAGALLLFRNGLLLGEGIDNDFVSTGRDIDFTDGNEPQEGDVLLATYQPI